MSDKKKSVFNIGSLLSEYIELKNRRAEIEKQMEEMKPEIEKFLEEQPEKAFQVGNWKINLVHSKKESFNLKKAKENLDGRVLKPYLKVSEFTQIRTVFRGEKKE